MVPDKERFTCAERGSEILKRRRAIAVERDGETVDEEAGHNRIKVGRFF
jgi:hypothetical protein